MGATEIFGTADPFSYFRVTVQLNDKFIGGVPKDPDVIRKWIEARINQGADLALNEVVQETVEAMRVEEVDDAGVVTVTDPEFGEVIDAVVEKSQGGNGFKRNAAGLIWEGRCAKAAVKEATNVAYPGAKWPEQKKTGVRKGAMNALAERFFVCELQIPIMVQDESGEWVQCTEPSGTEQRVKRVKTPQGERSAITVVDYVERPRLTFHVGVLDDFLSDVMNGRIWEILQFIGIGADRARSDGTFELVEYARVPARPEVDKPYLMGGPYAQ